MLGPVMNEADAEKIIIAEVKAMLVRRDPLTRLLDDYVRAAIMERNPGIHKYLPKIATTPYTQNMSSRSMRNRRRSLLHSSRSCRGALMWQWTELQLILSKR